LVSKDSSYNYKPYEKDIALAYGWNTENDSYFATSGDKFNLTYSKIYYENQLENFHSYSTSYQKNFYINEKNSITGDASVYLYGNESETSLTTRSQLDFQYNYQVFDNYANKDNFFQKARLYYKLAPSYSQDYSYKANEVGFLFDSKELGIVKLSLTHWSPL
jgi:hypothetical protein